MVTYQAPLDDIRFVMFDLLDYDARVASLPPYGEAAADLVDSVLEEGARFCEQELLPLNRSGDEEGCRFENGVVYTPEGFKDAYRRFAEGGWVGVSAANDYDGQGLPNSVYFAFSELMCSTNLSFGIYPGLTHGAYDAIEHWADDELKNTYLPRLASGEWAGTMNLTEPHAGTDLGLIRSRAEPQDDGSYRITGTKIFISGGEQDLTENIIHLVLAKLPDAPPGTKGISMFLVPKFLVNEDGSLGARNGVFCGSIEHKMGIKASSTCVMNYDEAIGYLVGERHGGMKAMFTMMNEARLLVGMQGLGLAETAYQSAVAYAKERHQGRSLAGPKAPDKPADPIIVHPDVRNHLLTMRAINEASRALALWIGLEIDVAKHHTDPKERQQADDLVQLMTPIIKAFFTDHGTDAANRGVQIFGGHGYIREWGMEQLIRDARIAQLYEGANGIQALDLVGRKMGQGMGRLLRRFFHPVQGFIDIHQSDATLGEFTPALAKAFGRLQQATVVIAQRGLAAPEEAGAAASDYLRLFALVALAFMWARMVAVAAPKANGKGNDFYRAKLDTARFFYARVLPETSMLFARVMAGKASVMAPADETF
ncbi:MAG: acyl-CoA dehydrogenase C-terminal domain-containing protein [Geminicoccaceae bacterium]